MEGTRDMVISSGQSPSALSLPEEPQAARVRVVAATAAGMAKDLRMSVVPFGIMAGTARYRGRGCACWGPAQDVVVEIGEGGASVRRLAVGFAHAHEGSVRAMAFGGREVVDPDVADGKGRPLGKEPRDDSLQAGGFADVAVDEGDGVGDAERVQGPVDADLRRVGGEHAIGVLGEVGEEFW